MKNDIGIIGLGPAGHKMALLALKKGLKVICFEKNFIGGTCLNVGCIPTKSMLHDSESKFSWEEMLNRKNKIVETFRRAIEKDLTTKGAIIIHGEAKIENGVIVCDGKKYEAEKIIVASGSEPMDINCDGEFVLNSDQIFNLKEPPKSIVIVGSGAIGIEWARIFHNLGVDVTIVEKEQNLFPASDIDISKRIERIFKIKKIKFYTNCSAKISDCSLILSNGELLRPEKVLMAIGRKRSSLEGGYKIGDANTGPMLAHNATAQAKALFEHLYENKPLKEIKNIPSVVYGKPEIASIGICGQKAENAKIYNLPISYLAKAHCDHDIEGFIKIIAKNDKIIGASIIAQEASAMITQIAIAMEAKMTLEQLKEVIFPHPTLSEGILEALDHG